MTFIQASITYGTPDHFRKAPGTLGGLKRFLMNCGLINEPGMNDTTYPDRLPAARTKKLSRAAGYWKIESRETNEAPQEEGRGRQR